MLLLGLEPSTLHLWWKRAENDGIFLKKGNSFESKVDRRALEQWVAV
jgi:hypothetical protein